MTISWQAENLIELVQAAYPDWADFHSGSFAAEEVAYKRATADKAAALLGPAEIERLLANWQYDELISRLERLGRDNNLLWNRMPTKGDLAILSRPELNKAEFCLQLSDLLYGSQPSPNRLEAFSRYLQQNGLPNKWTFATYFLFITRPEQEFFVKPEAAQWFLRFMGRPEPLSRYPTAAIYQILLEQAMALKEALWLYQPEDMIDIQSLLWVSKQESQKQTGRLDLRGQVELDVPPTYEITPTVAILREKAPPAANPLFTLTEMADQSGYDPTELARWVRAIRRKGQIVLYGPPGTGKTFMAQLLARHLVGGGDGLAQLVQFHPNYGYEEFVQGIRPVTTPEGRLSYELLPGRLLTFCQAAGGKQGASALIIDEINRANLPRVFGELLYLLEYRSQTISLAGGGTLQLPANLYLIATMNTADRSIALVDHALRRRFAFIHLPPHYQSLGHYHQRHPSRFPSQKLIALLQQLNNQIGDPNYAVGTSFFLRPHLADELADIWQMEIEPYLEELFFDRPEQLTPYRWPQVRQFLTTD